MVEQLKHRSLVEMLAETEASARAEGFAEGLAVAKRWLKRDIEHRFGPLPYHLSARIDAFDTADALDTIRERLDSAGSAEDLFVD